MMNIEVLFFGEVRELAVRQRVISMPDGIHLSDVIEYLTKEYGVLFNQKVTRVESCRILINGSEHEFVGGMGAKLRDGDVVVFLAVTAGG